MTKDLVEIVAAIHNPDDGASWAKVSPKVAVRRHRDTPHLEFIHADLKGEALIQEPELQRVCEFFHLLYCRRYRVADLPKEPTIKPNVSTKPSTNLKKR